MAFGFDDAGRNVDVDSGEHTQVQPISRSPEAMVGRRMPLLFSASGRAYFAACSSRERAALVDLMRAEGGRTGECASSPSMPQETFSIGCELWNAP